MSKTDHPVHAWAASGAMALTGFADGPPVVAPAALASFADATIESLERLAGDRWTGGDPDGAALLGERAAIFGLRRGGRTSPSGTCKLLRCADDWIAVNLPRAADWECIPAWLGEDVVAGDWKSVEARLAKRDAGALIERARLLGLPVGEVARQARSGSGGSAPLAARGTSGAPRRDASPLVVDLSSLWAGPLASHLLLLAGARVVKVESTRRPDGARAGRAAFFDLLNEGKESVALDFAAHEDRALLSRLIEHADIVIEGSRPRALAQLGIDAARMLESQPGKVWVSITGHGRSEPECEWIAFGDDASAAAGLVRATGVAAGDAGPIFCGDAMADPLTGLHAALAALTSWRRGEGGLLDLSLRAVTELALREYPMPAGARVRSIGEGPNNWEVVVLGEPCAVAPPRTRVARGRAPVLGAHNGAVLAPLSARRAAMAS